MTRITHLALLCLVLATLAFGPKPRVISVEPRPPEPITGKGQTIESGPVTLAPRVLGGKDGLVGLDSDRSAGRVSLRGADSQALDPLADDPIFNARFAVEGYGVISVPDAPPEWGAEALAVMDCESHYNTDAVGVLGELGLLQVHPIHFQSMRNYGLDPYVEDDRIQFSYWMTVWGGWRAWSCEFRSYDAVLAHD